VKAAQPLLVLSNLSRIQLIKLNSGYRSGTLFCYVLMFSTRVAAHIGLLVLTSYWSYTLTMTAGKAVANGLAGAQQRTLINLSKTMHPPKSLFLALEGSLPLFTELPRRCLLGNSELPVNGVLRNPQNWAPKRLLVKHKDARTCEEGRGTGSAPALS